MTDATGSALGVVAYLALFAGAGLIFLFVNLLVGRLVRPQDPHPEKLEVYECGEPTIGSSFVQFDLRFYVVALLFIIFDVEVAFFFPWATVFGKANHLADPSLPVVTAQGQLTPEADALYREMGIREPQAPATSGGASAELAIRDGGKTLAKVTLVDIFVFFAVLIIGFAYVWRRGDLDWVRAVSRERGAMRAGPPPDGSSNRGQSVLSA
ncbi:MAG: NADH-quinone oxidoreductase subunit A [Planctomycetales bacterium]|nr:NADH-quinone oxidoreductase subunit A [Planctomycetales bacterium]